MASEIYNFIWVTPPDTTANKPVSHQEGNTINRPVQTARAVILFPALLTPLVFVDSDDEKYFELLVAADKDLEKLPDLVNRQLKISLGLDPRKPFDPRPLFGGGACDKISVKHVGHVGASGTEILKTASKFAGILHPAAGKAIMAAGLPQVYAVKVHKSCLPVSSPGDAVMCSRTEPKVVSYVADPHSSALRRGVNMAVVGAELHDVLIRKMLEARLGKEDAASGNKADSIPGRCRYAFPVSGSTVDLSRVDRGQPVQSYHPLVVYSPDSFEHASIGHFSDLHVNCRWQILGKSPARVIEYGEGKYEDESPPIGKMVAETNRSVHNTMHDVFASDAHLVVVGGDLIDHIRNAYDPRRFVSDTHYVRDVWEAMDLDAGYTDKRYPYGIDLVAFYSMILDAIRSHKKPAFGISGNHDCYVDSFGISPRVATVRANAGIPADLNLTFYEALLAFGPTAGMLRKTGSSFDKDWFEWFYLVFSPFNDWWAKLPKQSLVGLGWGDGEALIDAWSGGQGHAHLPRSTDGVSDPQLGLLKEAVAQQADHKVTLTTHFTFLSFDEKIPNGSIGLLETGYKNEFEFGTFEKNRASVIEMLKGKKIECVLTGHSHRRGLYLLKADGHAKLFDAGVADGLSVPEQAASSGTAASPSIIVSDSAGPYPRNNQGGEFESWGSDRPGGTLVTFDPATGAVSRVKSLQATLRPPPRAAVSLDYADVQLDGGLFEDGTILVLYVPADQASGGWGRDGKEIVWRIRAPLTGQARGWKIWPSRILFAYQDVTDDRWVRVETVRGDGDQWVVPVGGDDPAKGTRDLRNWLKSGLTGFVSMQFSTDNPHLGGYNWTDHWNFEAVAETVRWTLPGDHTPVTGFKVARPTRKIKGKVMDCKFREIPNFTWREQHVMKYQLTSL